MDRSDMPQTKAQGAIRLVLQAAPAIAGAAAFLLVGGERGEGLVVAASILLLQHAFARRHYPIHLMPFASGVVAVVLPVLGVLLAAALIAISGGSVGPASLPVPAGVAAVVSVLVWRLAERPEAGRPTRVAVIGSSRLAKALADELAANGAHGIDIVGWIERTSARRNGRLRSAAEPPLLGSLDALRLVVRDHHIDLLIHGSAGPWSGGDEAPPIPRLEVFESVATCLDMPVRLVEASHFYEDRLGHVPLGTINSAWFQYIMHPRFRPGSSASKRLLDVVLAVVLAVALAPLIALAALMVKVQDGGPVLYRQRRLGVAGEEIEVLKLRSMSVSAESGGPQWSSEDDPRVTPVGRFLRRTHVDELPQLWNVLRGDMTLVGPRPERPEITPELELQHVHYDRRHLVKPGITGWAQVRCGYGGSGTGTAWKLCHDLYYLKHRSVVLDLLILTETIRTAVNDVQFDVRAPDERFILSPSPKAATAVERTSILAMSPTRSEARTRAPLAPSRAGPRP
jgi:exopolysaccharide biosynthesis polyprenyl glycosylphosphotransferase